MSPLPARWSSRISPVGTVTSDVARLRTDTTGGSDDVPVDNAGAARPPRVIVDTMARPPPARGLEARGRCAPRVQRCVALLESGIDAVESRMCRVGGRFADGPQSAPGRTVQDRVVAGLGLRSDLTDLSRGCAARSLMVPRHLVARDLPAALVALATWLPESRGGLSRGRCRPGPARTNFSARYCAHVSVVGNQVATGSHDPERAGWQSGKAARDRVQLAVGCEALRSTASDPNNPHQDEPPVANRRTPTTDQWVVTTPDGQALVVAIVRARRA